MRYGVSKYTLLITAGIIWLIAGINILQIGITYWFHTSHYWLFKICEASLIFLLFFRLIFHKVLKFPTPNKEGGK